MTSETKEPSQKLGFFMCVALVMGNMIGSGVFLLPASLAPFGWNGVVGWVITIVSALALALVIARLTIAYPLAGGPIGFVSMAFGRIPGYLIGWSYWVSVLTANVTLAVAAVSALSLLAPTVGAHSTVSTIALIWIITLVNWRGARAAGQFQVVTLLIKLVPLITVLILMAIILIQRGTAPIAPFPSEGLKLSAVSGSAILTLWALLGFESASLATDKVDNPGRTIPRATLVGTFATGALYLVVCSGIALMLPVAAVSGSAAPFAVFVETYWAREPALLIAAFVAVSAIGALNGFTLMQAELPATMARQGMLPRWFAGENAQGTPANALILSSLITTGVVLANSNKSTGDLFTFMATLSTSATLWLYFACACVALKLRVAVPVAGLGLIYSLWTLWGAGVTVSAMSLLLMAMGMPLYWWAKRAATTAP